MSGRRPASARAVRRADTAWEPLGDPLLLAADRFRIVAALDTDADGVLQPRARPEQVGAAVVDLGVFLVPENVAAFGVEKHDAFRQEVDGFAQALMGFSRIRDRGFRLGALAHDSPISDATRRRLAFELASLRASDWASPAGRECGSSPHAFLFGWLRPDTLHSLTPTRILRPMFSDKCLKKW